jgi:DNA-binding transcriptional regulator GbsR (MarR family)
MNKEDRDQILENLAKNRQGEALLDWITEEIQNLSDVEKFKTWDETLGKQYAVKLLRKLFKFLEKKKKPISSKEPNPYL